MFSNNIPKKPMAYFFKEMGLLLLFSLLFIFSFMYFCVHLLDNNYSGEVGFHLFIYAIFHIRAFCLSYLGIMLLLSFANTNHKIQIKIFATFLLNLLIIPFFIIREIRFNSIYLALVISTFVSFGVCFFIYYSSKSKPTEFL